MRTYRLLDFLFPGRRRARRSGRGPVTGQEAIAAALFNSRAEHASRPVVSAASEPSSAPTGASPER